FVLRALQANELQGAFKAMPRCKARSSVLAKSRGSTETVLLSALFDDLVGLREQCRRNGEAERLRGPEIDRQVELGRPGDRQVSRPLALENPAGVDTNLPMRVDEARPVAHQSAGFDRLMGVKDRRHPAARGQLGDA